MEAGKTRLDQLLVDKGMARTREKAKAVVMAGLVEVDGVPEDKPGRRVRGNAVIRLKGQMRYVSRGGLKLEAALKHFSVDIAGRWGLDVGASAGGFTDCLLQHGAGKVVAVDVGRGQLDWTLRKDPRVTVVERTNARFLTPGDVGPPAHGAVIDVSFISLRRIVPAVSPLLLAKAFLIVLIKPQFEVGKGVVGRGGVVRDPDLHERVIRELRDFFEALEWTVRGHIPSPILGPKGNREFLMYLTREGSGCS